MELGQLSTKKQSDAGKWFPVRLYGEWQDFAVKLFGSDSDEVRAYQKEQIKKLQKTRTDEGLSDNAIDEIIDNDLDGVIIRMNGIRSIEWKNGRGNQWDFTDEPVTLNGEEITDDEDSYRLLLEEIPALKEFVMKKSNERANFLDAGKKN